MKIWIILIRSNIDNYIWIQDAWDDDSTMENPDGWKAALKTAKESCQDGDYEFRVVAVDVPGLYDAFRTENLRGAILDGE